MVKAFESILSGFWQEVQKVLQHKYKHDHCPSCYLLVSWSEMQIESWIELSVRKEKGWSVGASSCRLDIPGSFPEPADSGAT